MLALGVVESLGTKDGGVVGKCAASAREGGQLDESAAVL
jgi:hypothetical protein